MSKGRGLGGETYFLLMGIPPQDLTILYFQIRFITTAVIIPAIIPTTIDNTNFSNNGRFEEPDTAAVTAPTTAPIIPALLSNFIKIYRIKV